MAGASRRRAGNHHRHRRALRTHRARCPGADRTPRRPPALPAACATREPAGTSTRTQSGPAMQACEDAGASVKFRRDHRQFEALCALAGQWPEVTVALSHACLPLERTPEQLREWWKAMRRLAIDHPNVVCKISAVAGASDPQWTVDSIRPWILGCVEAFGAQRCMLGSNWPVDAQFGTYDRLIDAYREVAERAHPRRAGRPVPRHRRPRVPPRRRGVTPRRAAVRWPAARARSSGAGGERSRRRSRGSRSGAGIGCPT